MTRRVVLVGCGHAHLAVVRGAAGFAGRSTELVLVDPGLFWYSGRGSGVLGGRFTQAQASLDPERLAHASGAGFVREAVTGLDRAAGAAILGSGRRIGYDLISFNVGSRVPVTPSLAADVIAMKPIGSLPALRERLVSAPGRTSVLVIGGGATGCEIAGNLLHLRDTHGLALTVTMATSAALILPDAPRSLRRRALESLAGRGARLLTSTAVEAVEPGWARLKPGGRVPCDIAIGAMGLAADPLVSRLGLPWRGAGLRVSPNLQSIADLAVFAAGDCAAIEGCDLPKLGVHGVRAGPVLLGNLLAALDGRPLRPYRPQRSALSILDLADGQGLAMRAGFWFAGRSALWLKDRLDRRFLDRYAAGS